MILMTACWKSIGNYYQVSQNTGPNSSSSSCWKGWKDFGKILVIEMIELAFLSIPAFSSVSILAINMPFSWCDRIRAEACRDDADDVGCHGDICPPSRDRADECVWAQAYGA